MNASYLFLVLLIVTAGICTGCYQRMERQVQREQIVARKGEKVTSVILRDGSIVRFDDEGGVYRSVMIGEQQTLCIVGRDEQWKKRTIPVADISEAVVRTRKYDAGKSILVVVAAAATIIITLVGLFLFGGGFKT